MIEAIPPALEGHKLAYLTEEHVPQAMALLQRCADYLDLVAGVPPSASLVHDLFLALPPKKGYEDKVLLGIWSERAELIGLLDAVRGHPAPEVWFLGLLLLDPAHRRHGLGERVYRAFEQWAKTLGAGAVRLSVAEQNEAALRFWRRLGFREVERKPPEMFGAKESRFVVMERAVISAMKAR